MSSAKKKVLLIGWDAADWKVIQPLIDSGEMPTLKKFIEEGVSGNIATMEPALSPMLWTSIATGKTPEQHGIHNFTEPNSESGGIRPITNKSRKAKAVWNILNQKGYKSNVISWWPSNPAEPINGVMVSNLFQKATGEPGDMKPLPKGTVHPKRLEQTVADLRVHPGELTEEHIAPFVPDFAKIAEGKHRRLESLGQILAETASVQSVATHIMENEEWDFMAVYFDGIDHFSHAFMNYHPPKVSPKMSDEAYNMYKHVVRGGYKFHDMMLERLLELAGPDTTVIINSDHGFHSDHLRPLKLPNEPAAPAYEHRDFGIFCINGPGIKKGEKIYGVSLLDIAPTILSLFDLPIGRDMKGKALVDAFDKEVKLDYIDSWENVKGETGEHDELLEIDQESSQESLQQLIDLGYIEDPGENKMKAAENSIRESDYNLGRSLLSLNEHTKALLLFKKLYEAYPEEHRFAAHQLVCMDKLKYYDQGRQLINLVKARVTPLPVNFKYYEGVILMGEGHYKQSLKIFKQLSKDHSGLRGINIQLGNVYLKLKQIDNAIESFETAVKNDLHNAKAYYGLGLCYSQIEDYENAIDNYLQSVELVHYNPSAHFFLGESLALNGEKEFAVNAFNVAVQQAPGIVKAHQWLSKLYKELGNESLSQQHQSFAENNIKVPTTIVSGLPRSGTSMMMQILEKGGMSILSDRKREADNNNPKGYYEYEPVKNLAKDSDWLNEVGDEAIKVIAHLLPHLSTKRNYRVIFMERDIEQVLKSQQKMIGKSESEKNAYPLGLASTFDRQLSNVKSWLSRQPNVEVIYMNYADVIENGMVEIGKINDFVGGGLDTLKMREAIDQKLFRNVKPTWS